ncbi:MAG: glyoxalase [Nonomuraea sp.]|nr:glyoxalase [Nonomuraea sp.]
MPITTVATVTVPVSDQDKALAFYVGVLGFEIRTDNPFPMGRWLTVAPEGGQATLLLASWFPQMAPIGGLVVYATDVDELAVRLGEAGTPYEGPTDERWGRQLLFHDPFGNGFAVTES